jgi:predicted dehydrogenase
MKALEHGKHLYSEKPLATVRDEGRTIVEAAKEKGLSVGCAPDTFLGGGLQTCRKLLDDGWIGTPFGAIAFMIGAGPAMSHPHPDFYYKKGAGPMMDMGPYYVTALVSLLGPVARVTGMATTPSPEKTITGPVRYGEKIKVETPTYISGTMEFHNGVCGNLLTSFDLHYAYWDSKLPFMQIFGSEGTLSLPNPDTFGGPVLVRRFGGEFTRVPLTHGFLENSRGIGLADMAASILRGTRPRACGDMAFHVLDVMVGFLDSAESGSHCNMTSTCERPEALARVLPKNSTEPA